MPTVHVVDQTPVTPERVLEAARDSSAPGSVKGVVTDSNIFKPGSTWEIRATPENGGSRVEVIGVRHLRGFRGRLLAPVFPLGLARRTVADHLRHFLSKIEERESGSG
ncbi:MAG TPA: hypothetical protein VFR14_12800 [Candidatus Limnocylindrales bacterium]|nr:hypothetical protein [Candidatus Limnocylindrales bacterium]